MIPRRTRSEAFSQGTDCAQHFHDKILINSARWLLAFRRSNLGGAETTHLVSGFLYDFSFDAV